MNKNKIKETRKSSHNIGLVMSPRSSIKFLGAIVFLLVVCTLTTPNVNADNSTAFLKFQLNETSGTLVLNEGLTGDGDDPQGAFNGTITGSVTVGQTAKNSTFGTAYDFSGGRIEIGGASSVFAQGTEDFSICFWMNPDTWSGSATPFSQYGGDGDQDGYRIQQHNGTSSFLWFIYQDGDNQQVVHSFENGTPVNKWTQICVMRQDTTAGVTANLTVIENNYQKQTTGLVTSKDVFNIGSPLCIGVRCNNNDRPFDGKIDHFYYWNHTINESFVQGHFDGFDFSAVGVSAPVIPDIQPSINVSILTPLNATNQTTNPLNITFRYYGENASFCGLYTNITGALTHVSNITTGLINITTQFNTTFNFTNTNDTIAIYRFEEGTGNISIDLSRGNNATLTTHNYVTSKLGNNTGNSSINLDIGSAIAPYQSYYNFGTTQDFTISAWVRSDDIDSAYHIILDTRDGGGDGVFLAIASDDTIQAVANAVTFASTTTITDSNWYHVVAVFDRDSSSNSDIYINNVSQSAGALTSAQNINTVSDIYIGRRSFSPGVDWEGDIDELFIFNKSLGANAVSELFVQGLEHVGVSSVDNTTEVQLILNQSQNHSLSHSLPTDITTHIEETIICLLNSSVIGNQTFTYFYNNDFTPPVITLLAPELTGNVTSSNVDINISINELGICTLNNGNWSLASSNQTFFFFEDNGANSSLYELTVTCEDFAQPPNQATLLFNFTKDVVQPIIITTFPNEFNITIVDNTGTLEFYTNITDDFGIFGYTYNITDSSGTLLYSENQSGISGLSKIINPNLNTGNWSNETLTVSILACDSHTAQKLSDNTRLAKIKKTDKNIEFTIGKGRGRTVINVTSLGGDELSTDVYDKLDRKQFNFKYKPNTNTPKKYRVETNQNLWLINSQFTGHAVIGGMGGQWIDFEGLGDDYVIDKRHNGYDITFFDVDTEEDVTFNSIGDLNCNNEYYTFDLREVEPPFFFVDINTTQGLLLIFFLIGLWLAIVTVGFSFNNFGFKAMGFLVGMFVSVYLFNINNWLAMAVMLINIVAFILEALDFRGK